MKKIAILGSGNIGCDLLVKCQETDGLKIVSFAGRHANSKGLEFACRRGAVTTDRSIEGVLDDGESRIYLLTAPVLFTTHIILPLQKRVFASLT